VTEAQKYSIFIVATYYEGTAGRSTTASLQRIATRKPTCGKKTKSAAVWATNSSYRGIALSQEMGESQWRTTLGRGTNGMAEARVAHATKLLEDVVRGPRPASSEALPWWHLFALNHFLEGFQGRCLQRDPRQDEPPSRCCRASGVAAPLYREKDVKTSPPCGEGSLQEKVSLLPGREWHAKEGLSHWTRP
jgi:hypothetical protein